MKRFISHYRINGTVHLLRRWRNLRRVPTTVEPQVPIKRHVKRIRSLVFGLVLKAFASGICVFGVRNRVPADLQIGQIFSDDV